jgi:hypothetical protein
MAARVEAIVDLSETARKRLRTAAREEAVAAFAQLGLPIVGEVLNERNAQDEKWGQQDHPDLSPDLVVGPGAIGLAYALSYYQVPHPVNAKARVDVDAKRGCSSWVGIALEELVEALEAAAAGDTAAVRTEVLQLAAVCVQWAQAIDRRDGAS